MDNIRHYINLVEGSQSYKTQLLSSVYTYPITESVLMEDLDLASLWKSLKSKIGSAVDSIWGGIKKLASQILSILSGVPKFIVNAAVKFIIWCASNPITTVLVGLGLANPGVASTVAKWAATSLAGAASGAATVAGLSGAGTRVGAGIGAASSSLTPQNLAKAVGDGPEFKPGDLPLRKLPPVDKNTQQDYDDMDFGIDKLSQQKDRANLFNPNDQPSIAQQAQDVANNASPSAPGIWDSIADATKQIEAWVHDKVSPEAIEMIANFAINFAIPIVAVAAIIYGGQKLYQYMKKNSPPKTTESKIENMLKDSSGKEKPANESMRELINKLS
jgi:hypothetical protein